MFEVKLTDMKDIIVKQLGKKFELFRLDELRFGRNVFEMIELEKWPHMIFYSKGDKLMVLQTKK